MSSLILPRRFNSQPQGAVDLAHDAGSFSSALLFNRDRSLITPNSTGNICPLNDAVSPLWTGDYCTSTYYEQKTNHVGQSLHAIGPNTINIGWRKPFVDLIWSEFTVLFVVNPATLTTSSHLLTGSAVAQFDMQFVALNLGADTVTMRNIWSGHWTAGADAAFTGVGFSNPYTVFAVTYANGVKTSYVNKKSVTHTGVGFTQPTLNGVLLSVQPGANAYAFYAAKRALSSGEVFSLVDNPWQLFRAKPRVLYFDVGGGGGNPTGTGSLIISATTASGSGVIVHKGSGALSTPAATLACSGKVTHNGTGDLDTPAVTASGTAKLVHKGIGDLTTPAVTLDGTGSIVVAGAVTGSGALTTPAVTLSGSGKVTHKAQGDVVAPAVTLDGAGKLTHTGTGDITTPEVELDGYDQATPVEPDLPSYGGWRYHPYLHIRRKEDEKDPEIEASPLPAKQIKKAKRAEVARTAERESEEQDQFERGLLDKLESVLEGKVLAVADDLTEARNKKLETQRIEAYKLELLQIAIQEEDELMLILLAA